MNNDEIKEFMKHNEENNYQLGISATLTAIITILIKNNITTEEEFKKIQKYCLEKVKEEQINRMTDEEEQINRMTDEEKKQIETLKTFNDLFGNVF